MLRSIAQRQRHPNCYKHPAAKLIEAFADASQPWADAIGHAGQEEFRGDLDGGEGAGHDDELQEQAAMRVEELRQKRGEEQDRFRVRDRRQRALLKHRPTGSRL